MKLFIFGIVLGIVITLVVQFLVKGKEEELPEGAPPPLWNERAQIRYERIQGLYGPPDILSKERNGFAFWKNKGPLNEILVRDSDFVYLSIYLDMDENYLRRNMAIRVDKSLMYDAVEKKLVSKTTHIEHGVICLLLGAKVYKDILQVSNIEEEGVVHEKSELLISDFREYKRAIDELSKLI